MKLFVRSDTVLVIYFSNIFYWNIVILVMNVAAKRALVMTVVLVMVKVTMFKKEVVDSTMLR